MQIYNLLHHSAPPLASSLNTILLAVKSIIAVIGTFVILIGVIISLYRFIVIRFFPGRAARMDLTGVNYIRRDLGLTIILGLEFIIAADVIETTTTPDYYSLGILGIIVIIRTFLSYSLNREISALTSSQKHKLD